MKGRVIALGRWAGHKAAALIEDGRLEDLIVDDGGPLAPGAILRAVCTRPMKGQGGMMLELPGGVSGYLRKGRGLAPGRALLVQVSGRAEDGKAVPLSPRLLFKSRYAILTPEAPGINISRRIRDDEARVRLLEVAHDAMAGSDSGLILRSLAESADPDVIADDIAALRALAEQVLADPGQGPEFLVDGPDAHALAWRDWPAPELLAEAGTAFADHGVDDMIATILAPEQRLKGGGIAYVEPTRAFVAVDVNTAGDTSQAAGLKVNIALARDLPRLLRCRGLGGQVIIDFAPMAKKDRPALEQVLRAAFRRDDIETALAGWTPLGNYELQRKRARVPVPPEAG